MLMVQHMLNAMHIKTSQPLKYIKYKNENFKKQIMELKVL
jgi:hypothetical protein